MSMTATLPWSPLAVPPHEGDGEQVAGYRRLRTYPADRVCAHPGCGTRLSRYNATKYCTIHAADAALDRRPRSARNVVMLDDGRCVCTVCGQAFPLTAEYFQPTTKNSRGFYSQCRSCHRESEHARYHRSKTYTCRSCGESKPRLFRNFAKTPKARDGLSSVCRECDEKAGKKVCAQCGQAKKLGRKHWHEARSADGFAKLCKVCQDEARRRQMIAITTPKGTINAEVKP